EAMRAHRKANGSISQSQSTRRRGIRFVAGNDVDSSRREAPDGFESATVADARGRVGLLDREGERQRTSDGKRETASSAFEFLAVLRGGFPRPAHGVLGR